MPLSFKERLRRRQTTLGSWITLGHPAVAEILCDAGFDWLSVDLEHSVITLDQAQQLIQVISAAGVVPLVRVGANDALIIKRVMDAGATGVIVPLVNSREDAERAVEAVYYPPRGKRGVGLARAQRYGFGFEEYRLANQEEAVVIVQIEHIQAVKNLREILRVPGVDGFIIGPYDLSGSLGKPGAFTAPEVRKALVEVETVAREEQALAGFHVVPVDWELLAEKWRAGYRFLAHSLDTLWLGSGPRRSVQALKKLADRQEKNSDE